MPSFSALAKPERHDLREIPQPRVPGLDQVQPRPPRELGLDAQDAGAGEGDAKKPTIRAVGLSVTKPIDDPWQFRGVHGRFADDANGGTRVNLLVQGNGSPIIGIDEAGSSIDAFTDSLGNDLMQQPEPGRDDPRDFFFAQQNRPGLKDWRRAEDGSAGLISAFAPKLPEAQAMRVMLRGNVVLTTATEQKIFQKKNVKLENGTAFTLGEIKCRIEDIDARRMEDREQMVMLKFDRMVPEIVQITFRDAEGEIIEANQNYTSTAGGPGNMTVGLGFEFEDKPAAATIEFTRWVGMKKVNVPFQLEIGMGLDNDQRAD